MSNHRDSMIPDVQLHSNGDYWHAVWTDMSGRRVRRSIGAKRRLSRVEAVSACARIAAEIAMLDFGGLPTLDTLEAEVIDKRRGSKPATITLLRRTAELLRRWADQCELLPQRRHSRIDDVTRKVATDFREWLFQKGGNGELGRRMSQTTIASHLRRCRLLWNAVNDTLGDELVIRNPWARRGWSSPVVAPEWAEVTHDMLEALMAACRHEGVRIMLALCRLAGLRSGEARRLRVQDVDLSRRMLRILPEQIEDGSRPEGTKQRERTVPVCPRLAALLQQACRGKPLGDPVCQGLPNSYNLRRFLVGGKAGRRRLASGKPRRYLGLIRKAGFEPWAKPLHTLRRNCGTEWGERNIPLADLARWMGNSPSVAAKLYLRTTPITFALVTGLPQQVPQTRNKQRSRKRI